MSSLTSPASSRTASPGPQPPRSRPNRAALRDYYGLKSSAPADATPEPSPQLLREEISSVASNEFDSDAFDAEAYVQKVLATKHLDEILKIESNLISEIRSLDGEKKALVYDNYSKLITATDTIRKMRDNMGPLMPDDSRLNDDIANIARSAESLAVRPQLDPSRHEQWKAEVDSKAKKRQEVETVKWVLDAPRRLKALREGGKVRDADEQWKEVKRLLELWRGAGDAEEIMNECTNVMEQG